MRTSSYDPEGEEPSDVGPDVSLELLGQDQVLERRPADLAEDWPLPVRSALEDQELGEDLGQ